MWQELVAKLSMYTLVIGAGFLGLFLMIRGLVRQSKESAVQEDRACAAEESLAAKERFDEARDAAERESDDAKLKWMRDSDSHNKTS